MTGVAQKLKAAGYVTHFTGKWDAGMATPAHTPAGRGYDSSYAARVRINRSDAKAATWTCASRRRRGRDVDIFRHRTFGRDPPLRYGYFQHANGYWDKRGRIESTGAVDLCLNQFHDFFEENATYFRRAYLPTTGGGDAAAAMRIVRGDESRRRRGYDVDVPWRRVARLRYRGGVLDPAALDASCSADAGPDPPCYAEKLFKDRAVGIIEAHAAVQDASPLFYMHSFHLAHTPLNVPQSYVDAADKRLAAHGFAFDDAGRRNYSAMVSRRDRAYVSFGRTAPAIPTL